MSNQPEVIVVYEKPISSIIRDGFSVMCAFALVMPGWLIGSNALQLIGVALFFAIITSRAMRLRKDMTMTITEARAKLDDLEATS